VAVTKYPKKGVQSPTPIGGLDFLDMDSLLKYPEIPVLDFFDTPPPLLPEVSERFNQCLSEAHLSQCRR
jgi:hypothetical protein